MSSLTVYQWCLYVPHCEDPWADIERHSWQPQSRDLAYLLRSYQRGEIYNYILVIQWNIPRVTCNFQYCIYTSLCTAFLYNAWSCRNSTQILKHYFFSQKSPSQFWGFVSRFSIFLFQQFHFSSNSVYIINLFFYVWIRLRHTQVIMRTWWNSAMARLH